MMSMRRRNVLRGCRAPRYRGKVNKGAVTVLITDTPPMNTLHCCSFGHCTWFGFRVIHQPRVRNSLLYLTVTSLACSLCGYRGS